MQMRIAGRNSEHLDKCANAYSCLCVHSQAGGLRSELENLHNPNVNQKCTLCNSSTFNTDMLNLIVRYSFNCQVYWDSSIAVL